MIDWGRVRELHDEIGDESFTEVFELFLEEVEAVLGHLGNCMEKLGDDLHFLKGCAWNLGFTEFGAVCQKGERQVAGGQAGEVDLATIFANYSASKTAFLAGVGAYCKSCGARTS